MKHAFVLVSLLSLGGCASAPIQTMMHRPAHHVVPASVPAPVPTPVVVTPPSSPVTVTKLGKPRWYDETKAAGHWVSGKVRAHVPHFHHKAAEAAKGN